MIKKTITTLSIAAMTAAVAPLPAAIAADGQDTRIQLAACKAACKPCKAKAACKPCNPCKAKAACSPCKAKAACKPCSPCKAKK